MPLFIIAKLSSSSTDLSSGTSTLNKHYYSSEKDIKEYPEMFPVSRRMSGKKLLIFLVFYVPDAAINEIAQYPVCCSFVLTIFSMITSDWWCIQEIDGIH
jgi:hypothetical protein